MDTHRAEVRMSILIEQLTERARLHQGVPDRVAREAAAVTMRRMRGSVDPSRESGRRRIDAYFWAVVRRRAFAGVEGLAGFRSRCVAATLAADLAEAGHSPAHALEVLTPVVGAERAIESLAAIGFPASA